MLQDIIRDKAALVAELEEEIAELVEFADRWDVDLDALARAEGFEFIALRDASVEALLIDAVTRRAYLERSDRVRRLFAAILPTRPRRRMPGSSASRATSPSGSARSTSRPTSHTSPVPVSELLDRSVGAEEYVIRAAAEGADADELGSTSTRSTSRRSLRGSPGASDRRRSGSTKQLGDQLEGERAPQPRAGWTSSRSCAS